jgi:hypothetical protein
MKEAIQTVPSFQAKKEPDLDIERWLGDDYNAKMHDAMKKDPAQFWTKHNPQLLAAYPKELDEYVHFSKCLLAELEKARKSGSGEMVVRFNLDRSRMKQKAWQDFIDLLRYKEYPVVQSHGECNEYHAAEGYPYTTHWVSLETPLF